MPIDAKRYPKNWKELALSVKEASGWTVHTLSVHHRNHQPEDNRLENLLAVCPACHLAMHRGGHGNASPGQLSLF